jgi:hypothetical protein
MRSVDRHDPRGWRLSADLVGVPARNDAVPSSRPGRARAADTRAGTSARPTARIARARAASNPSGNASPCRRLVALELLRPHPREDGGGPASQPNKGHHGRDDRKTGATAESDGRSDERRAQDDASGPPSFLAASMSASGPGERPAENVELGRIRDGRLHDPEQVRITVGTGGRIRDDDRFNPRRKGRRVAARRRPPCHRGRAGAPASRAASRAGRGEHQSSVPHAHAQGRALDSPPEALWLSDTRWPPLSMSWTAGAWRSRGRRRK